MDKNDNILEFFRKAGKTTVTMDDLKKKGFNANNYTNRIQSLSGEIIYSFNKHLLHRISDKEFVITKL